MQFVHVIDPFPGYGYWSGSLQRLNDAVMLQLHDPSYLKSLENPSVVTQNM